VILSAAAQREDRNVLPLPGSLRGGAAAKVVGALLRRGLIAETATDSQTKADAAPKARTPRTGTKQAKLIEMLRADGGATIDEIVAETGWQAHTVRGAMSGALKKKLGLTITSEKVEGRGRAYMIAED
jgi:hypothetical protein